MISNDEIKDIMKILKSLEDSGLSSRGIYDTIADEANKRKIIS